MNEDERIPSVEELRWIGVREEKWEPIGKKERLWNGRERKMLKPVTYVKTVGCGRMPLDAWYELMLKAVTREGLDAELERELEVVRGCAWIKTDKERLRYALERLANLRRADG